jgi:hypothetical protein
MDPNGVQLMEEVFEDGLHTEFYAPWEMASVPMVDAALWPAEIFCPRRWSLAQCAAWVARFEMGLTERHQVLYHRGKQALLCCPAGPSDLN